MRTVENGMRKYRKDMEKALKQDRFEHSLGVAYTSAALAMRFGEDEQKALIAGMLHDCAKGMDNEALLHFCRKHELGVSEYEQRNPGLLHAKVGAYLAEHSYGVSDPEILSAIRWHTTGRPAMTRLDKIVYLADIIEPNRPVFAEMPELRREIFADLDGGLRLTLKHLLDYLEREGGDAVDPLTRQTYEYYCEDA